MNRKSVAVILLVIVVLFSNSQAAFAELLGSATITYYPMNFYMKVYLSSNSNTSTSLDIDSMAIWVYNNAPDYVDEFKFTAHDHNWDKYTVKDTYYYCFGQGDDGRVEYDWSDLISNTVYQKNGNPAYVYTSESAGSATAGALFGMDGFWYSSSRSLSWH